MGGSKNLGNEGRLKYFVFGMAAGLSAVQSIAMQDHGFALLNGCSSNIYTEYRGTRAILKVGGTE